ncbi:hypothetical protein CDAR_194471 [Caerostris darwini]|uniref:Uncharacterized protein n=1 Tax=Caerostris darwini TaxID=1538125 RepID=A0AAV4TNE9_9ARAC|nr:hypothetical protein CDAR_194471 [Caerostris darwini]
MAESFHFDMNSLSIRCDDISSEMQDWRSVCSDISELMNLLVSAEINNLTYPVCRMKQKEISNLLGTVRSHIEASEAIFRRSIYLRGLLMQQDYNVLLKRILEQELRLLDMMRILNVAQISLIKYANKVKCHEISLHL